MNGGATDTTNFQDLLIEYLPSIVISVINIASQLIFDYMRSFKLYSHTATFRHYLIRFDYFLRDLLVLLLIFF